MLKKQLYLSAATFVFVVVLSSLLMQAKILTYPLLNDPPFPFGNLLIAFGVLAWPCMFFFGFSRFYYPITHAEHTLSKALIVIIILSLCWFPVGYLLSGNLGFNYRSTPNFQGGQLARKLYWYYNYAVIGLPILILMLSEVIKYLPTKKTMDTDKKIHPEEVARLLKGIGEGFLKFKFAPSYYWAGRLTVVIEFYCKGYLINIFVDAGELDYVDYVIAPDGRKSNNDYWESENNSGKDPLDYLSEKDTDNLIKKFEAY